MARTPGSTSKNKKRLWNALKTEYGETFDPILQMAKNCHTIQASLDFKCESIESPEDITEDIIGLAETANTAWDKITAYLQPKLKAVEHTGSVDVRDHMGLSEARDRVDDLLGRRTDKPAESPTTH